MAETNQYKTISKTNAGFPEYLDFDTLRREGIDYLGRLSGKLWTDHNVHDPGITILEMLCYALLDLGYRTNLPVADLFARNPEHTGADDNFFTPAQILSNSPLTITDYRKLLIDIPGVRNAWLDIVRDYNVDDFCGRRVPGTDVAAPGNDLKDPCCDEYVNGLYRVYLDLENNLYTDLSKNALDEKKKQEVLENVRKALMAHRNLCEDVHEIKILCKLELGVCADIELEDQADPEEVYLNLAEALNEFFSPAPKFYTLPQLLDKGKTIDEIFAGRPLEVTTSHGFADTEELEQIRLRKEIHLSDVYNVMLAVQGVKRVQQLRLRQCGDDRFLSPDRWKFPLPENHVPVFSVSCSGFRFMRYGVPAPFNFQKYEPLIALNAGQSGKVLYKDRYPYLDSQPPQGMYRNDLDEYYSIQNEFPRAYGIGEGGLPDQAPAHRKAQALQLKGYLLFFDQLLANYLAQLKNLRALFAMSSDNNGEAHTYFTHQLTTVPDLQKLLRFTTPEGIAGASQEGTLLAFPVHRQQLLDLLEANDPCGVDIESIEPYRFGSLDKALVAVNQLKDDFYHGNFESRIVAKNDNCVFYYVLSSSDCFALISRKYFSNAEEARLAAESLSYVAGFDENYRTYIAANGHEASFDIEFNLSDYRKYLQLIAEDNALYRQRRTAFLDHLLARFAEQFTHFAVRSYNAYQEAQQPELEIRAKEHFLSHYPDLSANRGRAYDYRVNGWNNNNISGFEKKFKVLSGVLNAQRQSLCHFEVARYNEKYMFSLALGDELNIRSEEYYDTKEAAREALHKTLRQAQDQAAYRVEHLPQEQQYRVFVEYDTGSKAGFLQPFASADEALEAARNLYRLFDPVRANQDIQPDRFQYTTRLVNMEGDPLLQFKNPAGSEAEASAAALKYITKTNDRKWWLTVDDAPVRNLKLAYDNRFNDPVFIDTTGFKIDIDGAIVGKPEKVTYEMLDTEHRFKFRSLQEFDNDKGAKEDYLRLLVFLTSEDHLQIKQNEDTKKYRLYIVYGGRVMAESAGEYESDQGVRTAKAAVWSVVRSHLYKLHIDKQPASWKFHFYLGYNPGESFAFRSIQSFPSREEAAGAAILFAQSLESLQVDISNGKTKLRIERANADISDLEWQPGAAEGEEEALKKRIATLAHVQREIAALIVEPENALDRFVDIDDQSKKGLYVYRLVDKDHHYAMSLIDNADKHAMEKYRDEAIRTDTERYNYLNLYVKGNLTVQRKDACNTAWYHYQLRSINPINKPGAGQPLVLFESTRGYASREEAEKAFAENYFHILRLAMDIINYRERKISTQPVFFHANAPRENDPIVYVPKETLDYLGDYEERAIEALIKVVKSYPVRIIYPRADCAEFNTRFQPCEPGSCNEPQPCCGGKEKPVWYFVLYNKESNREEWQSVKYYESAAEAWKDFGFFLILLRYPGNYHIDCGCRLQYEERTNAYTSQSVYRLYLREVLAESAGRFMTEEAAWGREGIQKFIDVSQTPGAFHHYLNKGNCCYSFYIACPNTRLYHPCKYDTPTQRDRAAAALYRGLQQFIRTWSWFPTCTDQRGAVVKGFNGSDIATVIYETNNEVINATTEFAWYTEVMRRITTYGLCIENDRVYLKGQRMFFTPADANTSAETLLHILQELTAWYPFTSRPTGTGNERTVKYCLEIKLPGFNNEQVHDCADHDQHCRVAWKGDCCYTSCQEAVEALRQVILLLSRYNNYKPVYDCTCHSYGIAIHFENEWQGDQCGYIDPQLRQVSLPCEHAIVAYNPQCYTHAEMACQASERAKGLINSEGLHVVEHLLLRPHCVEDCRCRLYPCNNEFGNCDFPYWHPSGDDPCDNNRPVCFKPGYDPYSFIATVVLPAWPEKYRDADNRLLLENILYREAPAHVLLRILWLAPHDFCCFEKHYKQWTGWLAQRKSCTGFDACRFLHFLFYRQYECLAEPQGCLPCRGDEPVVNPCDNIKGQRALQDRGQELLAQINTTFCWLDQHCGRYQFMPCDGNIDQPDTPPDPILLRARATTATPAGSTENTSTDKQDAGSAWRGQNAEAGNEENPTSSGNASAISSHSEEKERHTQKPELSSDTEWSVEPERNKPGTEDTTTPASPAGETDRPTATPAKKPVKKTAKKKATKKAQKSGLDIASKTRFFNNRLTGYCREADEIAAETRSHKTVALVRQYLDQTEPTPAGLEKLATEVLATAKDRRNKTITKKRASALLSLAIRHYFDQWAINEKELEHLQLNSEVFEAMRNQQIDMVNIYRLWESDALKKYIPGAAMQAIKKLLTGNK